MFTSLAFSGYVVADLQPEEVIHRETYLRALNNPGWPQVLN